MNELPSPLRARTTVLLLLFFTVPLFVNLTTSSLWDANEAFYVQTPREMAESNDWIVPTFNGTPRVNKPPLSYWLVAALYRLGGVSLFWERMLMAVAGAVSVLAVFSIGRSLFRIEVALLGAGILATTFRFLVVIRRLLIDALLLSLTLLGTAFFLRWLRSGRALDFYLSCLSFGLGFLAKGPIALAPIPILVIYAVWTRSGHGRPFLWVSGALVLVGVSSSWFIALAATQGLEPVRSFFLAENLGRFLNVDFGPRRGYGYYTGVFLADFFPWSIVFLWAMWNLARSRRLFSPPLLLLLALCAAYFVPFSLAYNKQEYYILPVYPFAGLLIAAAMARSHWPVWNRVVCSVTLLVGVLVLATAFADLFPDSPLLFAIPVFLALAAVAFFRFPPLTTAGALALFYFSCFLLLLGPLERYKPIRPMADTMNQLAPLIPQGRVEFGYYQHTAPSLRFYVNRRIHELYDSQEALRLFESDAAVFLITNEEGLANLQVVLPDRLRVIQSGNRIATTAGRFLNSLVSLADGDPRDWTRAVYLVSNLPPGEPTP